VKQVGGLHYIPQDRTVNKYGTSNRVLLLHGQGNQFVWPEKWICSLYTFVNHMKVTYVLIPNMKFSARIE
jgi:hypothetical protein